MKSFESFKEVPEVWKGFKFWKEEIEKRGIMLNFFNDVVVENRPPHAGSGFHLVKENVVLGEEKCDIYHTDQNEDGEIRGNTWHRIFIHKKEVEEQGE